MKTAKTVSVLFVFCFALFLAPACLHAAAAALEVSAKLPTLPIVHGVSQEIGVHLMGGDLVPGTEYEVILRAQSGWGVLLLSASPSAQGVARCRVGEPLAVSYRWSGAVPTDAPVIERVSVSVPALSLSAEVEFQVGMNLQVVDIVLPETIEPGKFSAAEVVFEDAFRPESDTAAILGHLGITPEIKLELIPEGDTKAQAAADDPAVARFFGQGKNALVELAYPGGDFKPGLLSKNTDGITIWFSVDGRSPGITPPEGGRYRLVATLRSNTGGIPIKEWSSEPFTVAGTKADWRDMPDLLGTSLQILSGMNGVVAERAAVKIRTSLDSGNMNDALASLGVYMAHAATPNRLQMLGRYAYAFAASGRSLDGLAATWPAFLRGYGNFGLLVFTKGGVKSWSAIAPDKTRYGKAPAGRVYEDDSVVVIPFEVGKDFTLHLEGSNAGETVVWKVIPQGVNVKKYPKGDWLKEIAVHTGSLTPAPQNIKYR